MKLNYLVLGSQMGKSDNGFLGKGDWTLFKCFFDDRGKYGEFFFNINTKTGEAEIRHKDADYADALTEAFGKEIQAE